MNKRAVIIVTPECPGLKKLPGAMRDAEEWEGFLFSPEGGGWESHEVEILKNPGRARVVIELLSLQSKGLDYSLLAFCGHGQCMSNNGVKETRLYLSSTDYVTDLALTANARRELVIVDACREYGGEVLMEELNKLANFANIAARSTEGRRARARQLLEEALVACPEGRSFVYSCGIGQTAADVPSSFTQYLIKDAKALAVDAEKIRCISIDEAFEEAKDRPKLINFPQQPEYTGQRRLTHIPFSVSV